ncbi:UNVERIFIED_CONTAM: hypothetical protein GTU68_050465 [Idotea baltica]|nr:hypothetical protein [Idotea baltica]
MYFSWFEDSPIGSLFLAGAQDSLQYLVLDHRRDVQDQPLPREDWEPAEKPFRDVKKQLKAYFRGKLKTFDLPLDGQGTDFQKQVWKQLLEIPYGETVSYADVAEAIGKPKACRAVGNANGKNPITIIVPCHRVIASGGKPGGYGGRLDIKAHLLNLEGVDVAHWETEPVA